MQGSQRSRGFSSNSKKVHLSTVLSTYTNYLSCGEGCLPLPSPPLAKGREQELARILGEIGQGGLIVTMFALFLQ
jgi:hypothetical protein